MNMGGLNMGTIPSNSSSNNTPHKNNFNDIMQSVQAYVDQISDMQNNASIALSYNDMSIDELKRALSSVNDEISNSRGPIGDAKEKRKSIMEALNKTHDLAA